jgi:hypothetical protein
LFDELMFDVFFPFSCISSDQHSSEGMAVAYSGAVISISSRSTRPIITYRGIVRGIIAWK